MQKIVNLLGIENILISLFILIIIIIVGFIILLINNISMKKKYKNFMQKIGNGKNIEEDLENYMYRVERVEKQNSEITTFCKNLDEDISKCIQKIGMVRYNAYKDTGSDLSFTLALLDEKNDGIVLNGIYSREMSNIYAKPIKDGNSTYTLSKEEKEAIEKAINENKKI
jgi:uncharacterized protein YoxC